MSKKEKTILYAICAVIVCAVVAVCVTQNTTGSREKEMKKLLANNWYRQWSESVSVTLYDDTFWNTAEGAQTLRAKF